MKNNFLSKNLYLIPIGIACLIGLGLLVYAFAPWGIGVEYDGFIYLSGASNIIEGNGYSFWNNHGEFTHITHFPPLYSIFVGGIALLTNLDLDQSATIINMIASVALISLSGLLVFKYSGSIILATFSSLLLAISDSIFMINQWALTESLFLVFLLIFFWFINQYLNSSKLAPLLLAGLVAGLSYLTRYVGLTIIGFGGLVILLNRAQNIREKIKNVLFFAGVSGSIIAPALIRNQLLGGEITSRNLVFHPIPWYEIKLALVRLSWWIFPAGLPQIVSIFGISAFVIVVIVLWIYLKSQIRNNPELNLVSLKAQKLITILGGFSLIYILFLLISLTFFDASTPLNNRIFSPFYLSGMLFVLLVTFYSFSIHKKPWLKVVWSIIWMAFLVAVFSRTLFMAKQMRTNGLGFNSKSRTQSSTLAWIQEQSSDILIYSNEDFPLSFLSRRYIYPVPEGYNPVDNVRVESYFEEIDEMHAILKEEKAYLIIFDSIKAHPEHYTVEELAKGLHLLLETDDGMIFYHPENEVLFND